MHWSFTKDTKEKIHSKMMRLLQSLNAWKWCKMNRKPSKSCDSWIFVSHWKGVFFTLKWKENQNETNPISGNRKAIKGIFIGCALTAITHFTAYYTLVNYATLIFSRTDTALFNPYVSTVIMAVAITFGSMLSTYLADLFGRKVLIIISMIACVAGLLSFALYHRLYLSHYDLSSFRWVPVSSLSFVIFVEAAGIMPISIVCSVENLPTKVLFIHTYS